MQDRYSGDVGDFGKFALLRYLFGNDNYKLGVIWYKFPNESHNNDGGYIEYINNDRFIKCDEYLCSKLSIVLFCGRSISSLEKLNLLPKNTIYSSGVLDGHLKYPSQRKIDKEKRKIFREEWLHKAMTSVSDCNIIFIDPDNGLQIASCSKIHQLKSGKFAYYNEIKKLFEGKESVIIYHHLNRHIAHGTHEDQIRTRVNDLSEYIKPSGKIFAARFMPYNPRAYFIITAKAEEKRIERNLNNFLYNSSHAKFWDSYYER